MASLLAIAAELSNQILGNVLLDPSIVLEDDAVAVVEVRRIFCHNLRPLFQANHQLCQESMTIFFGMTPLTLRSRFYALDSRNSQFVMESGLVDSFNASSVFHNCAIRLNGKPSDRPIFVFTKGVRTGALTNGLWVFALGTEMLPPHFHQYLREVLVEIPVGSPLTKLKPGCLPKLPDCLRALKEFAKQDIPVLEDLKIMFRCEDLIFWRQDLWTRITWNKKKGWLLGNALAVRAPDEISRLSIRAKQTTVVMHYSDGIETVDWSIDLGNRYEASREQSTAGGSLAGKWRQLSKTIGATLKMRKYVNTVD